MFRRIVVSALATLCTVGSVAQEFGHKQTAAALNEADRSAQTNRRTGSVGSAEARISIARLREPREVRRLYEKAMRAWVEHKPAESQRRLDQALKLYPNFPEALTFYGGIDASFQQWESAEKKLQAAIQSDPSYPPAYVVLAGVYNAEARFDDAQEATHQALAAGVDTWEVQYEIARAWIGKKQYETALAVSETALRSKHGGLLHLAKAHALLGLQRYQQAVAELKTFVHDEPDGDGSEKARDLLKRIASTGERNTRGNGVTATERGD